MADSNIISRLDALTRRAIVWLILAIAAVLGYTLQMQGRLPVETNLLALLPTTERNPVAETAVNKLAEAAGNRAVFLIGHPDSEQAFPAARVFADSLHNSGQFRHVLADIPPLDPAALTNTFLPYRFQLLSPEDRQQLQQVADNPYPLLEDKLQNKLYAPFRFGISLPIAQDPMGFMDRWISSLPLKSLQLEPENGMLAREIDDKTWVFVSAELTGSAYSGELQRSVMAAVSQAETDLLAKSPDSTLLRTGTIFYAGAAHANAEAEVHRISIVSLLGMLALMFLVFRSIRPLLLGLLSVGFGISAALAITLAVYGDIHLITVVFGASLIGEAIDYAIQYFAAHLGAGKAWEPMQGLRRIRTGLIIALVTSLMGYAALALAPFPALSQIALFALVGLSAACLSVFLLLPAFLRQSSQRDVNRAITLPQHILLKWQHQIRPGHCLFASLLILLLAIPGWMQLQANDDVHILISRPADLVAQEKAFRHIIGFDNSSQFFLVEGRDAETLLQHEENLVARLSVLVQGGALGHFQAISSFVPSQQRQQENLALWQRIMQDEPSFEALLSEAGLRDEIAHAQIQAFQNANHHWLTMEHWLEQPLAKPYQFLWLGNTRHGVASIVLPQGIEDTSVLAQAAQGLPGVTFVDKAGSVSALFHQYRQWSIGWLAIAIALIFGVLALRYRWRPALVILLPTLLAMVVTMSLFGYLGIPLTLFNMMSLMLMLGIGVNYAIFLREGGVHRAATLAGVLLSAGTTLLSFGMLAFSQMPALSSFGLTLLLGIAISALLAPMLLSFDQQLEKPASL